VKGLAFRISFIAFLLVLVPTLIFSVYEFSTLKKNEEIVKSIYINQLDAVLFSLNQFSEDIISGVAREIMVGYSEQQFSSTGYKFEDEFSFVESILISDAVAGRFELYKRDSVPASIPPYLIEFLSEQAEKINRLYGMYEANYQKLEPLLLPESDKILLLFAISGKKERQYMGFIFEPSEFINQVYRPKISQVALDKFVVGLVDSTGTLVYSTHADDFMKEEAYSSSLWLFPGYRFQIQLRGETIEVLIQRRSRINLIIILIVDGILLLGAFLIFTSIRKEAKLNQLKAEFISNVSHEIRTPLALIKMYIETLSMGRLRSEDKRVKYYSIINTETDRLAGMVNKILNFSKMDQGKQKLSKKQASLNEVVQRLLNSYEQHLDDKGFKVDVSLSADLQYINVDEELLLNALVNLLDNAMKYSADKKHIQIATGEKQNRVYIQISDSGVGISKKNQKHIFDKFFRVTDGNLAHKAKGSGIGLSIVKNVVDAHNGEIVVNSQEGEGTTFIIYLPLREEV
jgi:two-component system phosphate regulon sensor histidine kinase PhoR